jgi:hypothetical protein
MATPLRLVSLKCPRCGADHWELDSDFRGEEDPDEEQPYGERTYRCPACRTNGSGYTVGQKSPPEFFLQPHRMYPMSIEEFNHWVAVFREHFPDHPMLKRLGTGWLP